MNTTQTTRIIYILAGLVFIAGILLLLWFGFGWRPTVDEPFAQEDAEVVEDDCDYKRFIDGVCVEHKKDIDLKLVAVMVENHVDARPQSGISAASIVYEAPVEANYSRFMLIYPLGTDVDKVGPVRSARPYYLDWLAEYEDIMYMHVGGSPDALDILKERDVFDLNEFYRGWYYWRSTDRYAPHNVYTSSKLWGKAWDDYGEEVESKKLQVESNSNWIFDKINMCEEDCVDEITVSLLPPTYEAVWKFTSSTDQYTRYQLGYPHVDQDGSEIVADTIIVQHVETKVLDGVGRLGMNIIGSGDAIIFRDGYMIEGRWNKEDVYAKTQWLDVDGDTIALKSGKIWIEVVNGRGGVIYK